MRTDKQPVETLEEIADELIRVHTNYKGLWFSKPAIVRNAILSVLRNERERCARVAETHSATDCDGPDCGVVIARAIREGK